MVWTPNLEWLAVKILGIQNVYKLFRLIRRLYCQVDRWLDILTGYSLQNGWKSDRVSFETGGHSVHFVRVLGRLSLKATTLAFLDDYIWVHERYGSNPEQLLDDPQATVQGVTAQGSVWFGILPPDVDVYDTRDHPFAFVSEFRLNTKLAFLSLQTFLLLTEGIRRPHPDGPGRNPVVIVSTGRCGSTLLAQMFRNLGARVLSEPWALMHAHRLFNLGHFNQEQFQAIVGGLTKALLWPRAGNPGEEDLLVVLKASPLYSPLISCIKEDLLPDIRLVFISRHPVPTIRSFMGLSRILPEAEQGTDGVFWPSCLPLPYQGPYEAPEEPSELTLLSMAFGGVYLNFLPNKGKYEHSMLYEDLLENPALEVRRLAEALGMAPNATAPMLHAMKLDSQNEGYQWNRTGRELEESDLQHCDTILQSMGLPFTTSVTVDELRKIVQLPR